MHKFEPFWAHSEPLGLRFTFLHQFLELNTPLEKKHNLCSDTIMILKLAEKKNSEWQNSTNNKKCEWQKKLIELETKILKTKI